MRMTLLTLARRTKSADGFGLVELMIALTVLVIGVLATFGVFQGTLLHLGRAAQISTATAVGEQEIENFRAVKYDAIGLDPVGLSSAATNPVYVGDTACAGTCSTAGASPGQSVTVASGGSAPITSRTGADGRQYTIHTYIQWQTVGNGRDVKKITVVVRDPGTDKVWARIVSSFDQSTGM